MGDQVKSVVAVHQSDFADRVSSFEDELSDLLGKWGLRMESEVEVVIGKVRLRAPTEIRYYDDRKRGTK